MRDSHTSTPYIILVSITNLSVQTKLLCFLNEDKVLYTAMMSAAILNMIWVSITK